MRSTISVGLVVATTLLLAARTYASLGWVSVDPTLFDHMNCDQQPMKGNVVSYKEGREVVDKKSGKTARQLLSEYRYVQLPDKSIQLICGSPRNPMYKQSINVAGQLIKSEGKMTDGRTGESFISTVTLTYDANGAMNGYRQERDGIALSEAKVTETPTNDKGTLRRIEFTTGPQAGEVLEYVFNEKKLLESYTLKTAKIQSQREPVIVKRNDHGDVEEWHREGDKFFCGKYEYEYDTVGNWTLRKYYAGRGEPYEFKEATYREIEYGKDSAGPPIATDAKNFPIRDKLVGQFIGERGSEQDDIYSKTTLVLKLDGTAEIHTISKLKEQTFDKKATGRWTLYDATVTVKLQNSADGAPLPKETKPLIFTADPTGQKLRASDQSLLERAPEP